MTNANAPVVPAATPPTRLPTWAAIGIAVLLAAGNAFLSFIAVVMAVPGSGEIGPGFKIISVTFLAGNILTFGFALLSVLRDRKAQTMGQVVQAMTLPGCFGTALLVMYLMGVSDL